MTAIGEGGSASIKPVFVLGMPPVWHFLGRAYSRVAPLRPSGRGIGVLVLRRTHTRSRCASWDCWSRRRANKLAEDYLRLLETRARDASRIVDKTPVNSDYIGTILLRLSECAVHLHGAGCDRCLPVLLLSGVRCRPEFFHGSVRPRSLLQGALQALQALAIRCCRRKACSSCPTQGSYATSRLGRAKCSISSGSSGTIVVCPFKTPNEPS